VGAVLLYGANRKHDRRALANPLMHLGAG